MVEGGAHTLESFIRENLWNEAYVFTGTPVFVDGITAPDINKTYLSDTIIFEKQKIEIYTNKIK